MRFNRYGSKPLGAFTLIELLIVIAIILILIAIALPNFLAAQIRGKIAAVQGDLYAGGVAIESFRVDRRFYPPDGRWNLGIQPFVDQLMNRKPPNINQVNYWRFNDHSHLTTPVPYMKSLPREPFMQGTFWWDGSFLYENYEFIAREPGQSKATEVAVITQNRQKTLSGKTRVLWSLSSLGPDQTKNDAFNYIEYTPTNGIISRGDIYRTGP